ncbi:MAG: hypothetical protein ACPGTU_06935 [Myxococcota bacterium]
MRASSGRIAVLLLLHQGIVMHSNRLIEIEFPPCGAVFEAANSVVSTLDVHLGDDGYRVEPLIRSGDKLIEPWGDEAECASTYAYRIHIRPLAAGEWRNLHLHVFEPLARQGVSVREHQFAA